MTYTALQSRPECGRIPPTEAEIQRLRAVIQAGMKAAREQELAEMRQNILRRLIRMEADALAEPDPERRREKFHGLMSGWNSKLLRHLPLVRYAGFRPVVCEDGRWWVRVQDAANELGVARNAVATAANLGTRCCGLRWRMAGEDERRELRREWWGKLLQESR